MKGKLGGLFKGQRQVGGFLNWQVELAVKEAWQQGDTAKKYTGKWQLTADCYWLFDIADNVIIRLYPDIGKGYWEGTGIVESPTRRLFDVLISEPFEIIGEGILEGKASFGEAQDK